MYCIKEMLGLEGGGGVCEGRGEECTGILIIVKHSLLAVLTGSIIMVFQV